VFEIGSSKSFSKEDFLVSFTVQADDVVMNLAVDAVAAAVAVMSLKVEELSTLKSKSLVLDEGKLSACDSMDVILFDDNTFALIPVRLSVFQSPPGDLKAQQCKAQNQRHQRCGNRTLHPLGYCYAHIEDFYNKSNFLT